VDGAVGWVEVAESNWDADIGGVIGVVCGSAEVIVGAGGEVAPEQETSISAAVPRAARTRFASWCL
jgi:hypothetical protein